MRSLFGILLLLTTLSGCIVEPPPHQVYVARPAGVIVAPSPVVVATPAATAVVIRRPPVRHVVVY